MHKTSSYKKKEYVLSFGRDDVIYIDLEALIHKEGDQGPFRLEIVNCPLNTEKMEFACHLIKKLNAHELRVVTEELKAALVAELTPSLFTLFYTSDILPDESQAEQTS